MAFQKVPLFIHYWNMSCFVRKVLVIIEKSLHLKLYSFRPINILHDTLFYFKFYSWKHLSLSVLLVVQKSKQKSY
jgi:hypothetical protein